MNGDEFVDFYQAVDDLAELPPTQRRRRLDRLREAFDEDRFRLHCQAIVPTSSEPTKSSDEEGAHFEVLLRLHDKDGKLVPPMTFIPTAERYNLMVSIDQWVLKTAFSKLAKSGCERVATCSINLSGASLGDEGLLQFVNDCFERFAVSPKVICFEITETEAIANLANARCIIQSLKTLGCRFSLDDFGSGMSSFGYLKNLPVDYLKIDGGFIKNLANDSIDRAMVAAINNIGHVMGLKTIAEFVESGSVFRQLRELGVDYVQGYGIAEPEPLDTYLANLKSGGYDQQPWPLNENNL
jgi:EAL domain-containing protein (putative c-di-GMP-specific phosphodiesterase class I)